MTAFIQLFSKFVFINAFLKGFNISFLFYFLYTAKVQFAIVLRRN